jgi:plastocyanin
MERNKMWIFILLTVLMILSIFAAGCVDNGSDENQTATPKATETVIQTATETVIQTQTAEPTQEVTATVTSESKLIHIRIMNYMFIPVGDMEINVGDTIEWRNYENNKNARYLVNENGIWDEEQYLPYMRYVRYTFNETGVYTFYLKGRDSIKLNVTVV